MKILIKFIFMLSIINTNAQIEQTALNVESSAEVECYQIVKGEVRDKNTTDLLPDAVVVLRDKQGIALESRKVKEDAIFSFTIKCETDYILEGRRVDFTAESKSFTTSKEANKELKLIISLDKGNIDFLTNTKVEKTEVKIVEIIPEVVPDEQPIEIKNSKLEPSSKSILPTDNDKNLVNVDHIYFDYESSYLSKKAKTGLQKIVVLMKKYPKMIIECAGHTDSNGPDSYNAWMADRRAKRAVDYIVNRGIKVNRITGKGYGANQLINQCGKDVECTEGQHAENRRTEFVIIKT